MRNSRFGSARVRAMAMIVGAAMTPALFAQTGTTGDAAGVVKDTTDAVVAGAEVTLRNVDTGDTRTAATNDSGSYRFTFLKPGTYEVSAQTTGLKTGVAKIAVQVGEVTQTDLIARLQATQEVVEVSSQAAAVNTENANLSATFSSHQVEDLPAPGGDITTLAFTVPGIVMSTGMGYGNFSSHGMPGTSNLFTINGNDYNDPYLNLNNSGASNLLLGQNEVQEAAVVQNAYSAQYGRQAGAQVNYTTKSGTNGFHGNLLWNWNGEALNANSFFNNANGLPRASAISNEWADSIGGRIIKDKLFFYLDNEGLYYKLPASGVVSLPSPQLQSYILGTIAPAQQALYKNAFALWNGAPGAGGAQPITTGNGNTQDSSGRLGCGQFASTNTPAPGGGIFGVTAPCGDAFAANGSNQNREWLLTSRVDWNIGDKQKINFRFKHDTGFQPTGTSLINPVFDLQSVQPQYEGQINHTYIFSPSVVNNFVGSVLYYSAIFGPANVPGALAAFPTFFNFNDGGANGGGYNLGVPWNNYPQGRDVGQLQLIDDVSIIKGNHTIKIGENFRKNRVSDHGLEINTAGSYSFNSMADFIQGTTNPNTFSNYSQSFPTITTAHIRFYNIGVYAQDEWAAKPNLKLTLGARLDRTANPLCVDNCFSNLSQPFGNVGFPGGLNTPYSQIIQTGLSHAYYNVDKFVVDPRFGIVWSPKGDNKTVFRGGVGLFSDLAPGFLVSNIFSNAPSPYGAVIYGGQQVGTASDPASAAAAALGQYRAFHNGFTNGATLAQLNAQIPGGFSPPGYFSIPQHLDTPRFLEWSFEIQQPIGTKNVLVATYSGNKGYNLLINNGFGNAYVNSGNFPNGFGGLPLAAKDGAFNTVTQLNNSGISNYNGATISFHRTMSYGFEGEIAYTWSHALDDVSNGGAGLPFSFQPGAGLTNLSSPLTQGNYGNADYDIRNNLQADFVWDTPWKFGNRLANTLVGGWTLSSKVFWRSGLPFSVTDGQLAGLVSPAINATMLASYAANGGITRSCGAGAVNTPCFNLSQFVGTGAETGFGNVQRNSFYGPHYFDIDSSLYKDFAVTETMKFRIGASAFNLLNHPNFLSPNQNVAGSGFGLIQGEVSAPASPYGSFQSASVVSGRLLVLTARFDF